MGEMDNISVADDEGAWFIYKWEDAKLGVVFIHWTTALEFEDKRILSKPFQHYDDAQDFLQEFWNVWWRMSLP